MTYAVILITNCIVQVFKPRRFIVLRSSIILRSSTIKYN